MVSLHYNASKGFLFIDSVKMYQFKAKNLEKKKHPLFVGNISKDFTISNMKKKS